jgi:hypothetical protein
MNGEEEVYACDFEENFYKQPAIVQPTQEPEPYRVVPDAVSGCTISLRNLSKSTFLKIANIYFGAFSEADVTKTFKHLLLC